MQCWYRSVLSKRPYPGKRPPPILTVFGVLRVTAYHVKFCVVTPKVGPLSSHSCYCSDALWAPRHQTSKVRTYPSVFSFAAFLPCSTRFAYSKRWPNAAETWQRGYESVRFVARYSFLYCRAGLDKTWTKWQCKSIWYLLAANFAFGVGFSTGKVEPFKLFLCVTSHPKFLTLELRAPMGACPGPYRRLTQHLYSLARCGWLTILHGWPGNQVSPEKSEQVGRSANIPHTKWRGLLNHLSTLILWHSAALDPTASQMKVPVYLVRLYKWTRAFRSSSESNHFVLLFRQCAVTVALFRALLRERGW